MPEPKLRDKCISPTSHASNFISLGRAFADRDNFADYFDEAFLQRPNAASFFSALENGELKFMYVNTIKYHFMQTGKWIFKVEYFPRAADNSGWLISYIKKASEAERKIYLDKLLGYN